MITEAQVMLMRQALVAARAAIAALDEDALGHAHPEPDYGAQPWPIRNELLSKIDAALNAD